MTATDRETDWKISEALLRRHTFLDFFLQYHLHMHCFEMKDII